MLTQTETEGMNAKSVIKLIVPRYGGSFLADSHDHLSLSYFKGETLKDILQLTTPPTLRFEF